MCSERATTQWRWARLSGADRDNRHRFQKAAARGKYEFALPLIFVVNAIADGFLQQFLQFTNHLGIEIHLDLTLAPNQQGELTVRMGGKRLFDSPSDSMRSLLCLPAIVMFPGKNTTSKGCYTAPREGAKFPCTK